MKKQAFTRYLAAALALLMLLPLVSIPTFADESVFWSQDFNGTTSTADVLKSGAHDIAITDSATEAGNKVFQFDAKGYAPEAYYLFLNNNNKSPLTNVVDNGDGTITGDATVSGLTYNVTGVVNTSNTNTAATVNSCSGTAGTVYITTGELADAKGGFLGNVAVPNYFKHPAWNNADVEAFVIEHDIYLAPGTKGTIANQLNGTIVGTTTGRAVQPFAIVANGSSATLGINSNQSMISGSNYTMELGKWYTITIVIDKLTSVVSIYVDDVLAFTCKNSKTGSYSEINASIDIQANTFFYQYNRNTLPANLAGYVQIDNITFRSSLDTAEEGRTAVLYQDFESVSATAEILKAGAHDISITDSATEAGNKVFQFESKPYAPAEYYVWKDKNNKFALTNVVDNGDGTVTGDVTISGVAYNLTGVVNSESIKTTATVNSGDSATLYIVTGELADAQGGFLGNVAVPNYFLHSAWNNEDVEAFVIEHDIYLAPGTKGTIANQIDATVISTGASKAIQPFAIVANGSAATLGLNGNQVFVSGEAYTLELGKWYHLSIVIDKDTAEVSVYVEGVLAFTCKNKDGTGTYNLINAPVNLKADSFFYQINRFALPSTLAGYVQIDNLAFYNSLDTAESDVNTKLFSENFGTYSGQVGQAATMGTNVNVAATVEKDPLNENNTVIKIPFAPAVNDAETLIRMNGSIPVEKGYYAVTRNADTNAVEVSGYTVTANTDGTYNITDGTNTYSNLVLGKMSDYCAYWGGDGAMDQNWKMNHPAVSYESNSKVILATDVYISEDAHGKFISQLHNYTVDGTSKSWLELYTVDATNGKIGLSNSANYQVLTKGAWNHIELALDLVTGDGVLSVNGEEVETKNFGYTNMGIPAAKWNFAKLPRKQGDYQSFAGYIMVDNIEILTEPSTSTPVTVDPENLLYVEINGKKIYNNTFYVTEGTAYTPVYLDTAKYANMLTTEEKNSIRLFEAAGLRFATKVDTALLDELYALIDEGHVKSIELGTVIAPADYITTELTKEALDAEGKLYLEVLATYGKYYEFDDDDATTHIVGSIVDMYEANVTRSFVGRGYVTLYLKSGATVNLYSSFTQNADVQSVAKKVLEEGTYTAAQKAILDTFAEGKAPAASEAGQAIRAMKGLNVLAIGDSLFNGHSLSESDTWLAMMAQTYDWNFTNLGWDGWTVAKNDAAYADSSQVRSSMYDWLMNNSATYCYGGSKASYTYGNVSGVTAADVDLILLEGGTNDKNWGIPLGDISSSEDLAKGDNYLGALNQMIIKLKEMYPNAKIALVTSWHNLPTSTYTVDGMKALKNTVYAEDDTVVLVDAGSPILNGGVNMANSVFRAEYACSSSDVNHLNQKGMEIMLKNMPKLLWETLYSGKEETPIETTRVICVGDSITAASTAYWNTNLMGKLDDSYEVLGFGVSGSTALASGRDDGLALGEDYGFVTHDAYVQSLASDPDIVVIMLGTNDTKPVNSDRIYADNGVQFKADMIAMVKSYQELAGNPYVYIALPCTIYRERTSGSGMNDGDLVDLIIPLLIEVAEETGAGVIDVHTPTQNSSQYFSDGVHPSSDEGRDLIATAIAGKIIEDRA